MRKKIYLAIINKLKELKHDDDSAKIKHFDIWNHNVEFIEQEAAWEMPAIFVEFAPIQWKMIGSNVRQADVEIRLHIVTEYKGSTADGSANQTEALEHFELIDEINKKLFGMRGEGFNAFKSVMSATGHNHEEILENIEVYSTNVIDR